jgi:hypothetical protein
VGIEERLMPWFKVDDGFYAHPKTMELSDGAVCLWTMAGTWCAHHLTDGVVPFAALPALRGDAERARELLDAGFWESHPKGYRFHDWEQYQPTKDETLQRRRARSEAGRAGGRASGAARAKRNADDGTTTPEANGEANDEANTEASASANGEAKTNDEPTPTRPDPYQLPTGVANSITSPSAQCSPAELRAEFEVFWSAYPRKSGKAKAQKAFERARRTTTAEAMTEAAGRYRDDPNRVAAFTKEAAAWLNQQCWDDPPLPPRFERGAERPAQGPLSFISKSGQQQLMVELMKPSPDIETLRKYGMTEDQIAEALRKGRRPSEHDGALELVPARHGA